MDFIRKRMFSNLSSCQAIAIGMMSMAVSGGRAIAQELKPVTAAAIESVSPEMDVLGVYRPGEPIAWNVLLNASARNAHVTFVVKDWQGVVKQEGKNLLPMDSRLRIECKPR